MQNLTLPQLSLVSAGQTGLPNFMHNCYTPDQIKSTQAKATSYAIYQTLIAVGVTAAIGGTIFGVAQAAGISLGGLLGTFGFNYIYHHDEIWDTI